MQFKVTDRVKVVPMDTSPEYEEHANRFTGRVGTITADLGPAADSAATWYLVHLDDTGADLQFSNLELALLEEQ